MTSAREPRKAIAEPLRDGIRHSIDWTARTRGTILDAERYSRFVGVMKRALPIAAGVIIMAVVAYSLVPRPADRGISVAYSSYGRIDNDLAMVKPRLTGTDVKGNPFVITAESAIQDARNIKHAQLNKVEADMRLENNRWVDASATHGFVDADKGTLRLDGGISMFSDSGYELHTAAMDVDLRKGLMVGNNPVTGQGPMGAMAADRFTVDRIHQQIHLIGNVHTTIYKGKT
jgi:lipopolysaccharide export system protein LptC